MSKIVVKRVLDLNDVETPALGKVTLFIDDSDGKLKYKDEFGSVTTIGDIPAEPYVEYRALLSQLGGFAPSDSVLNDTIGGGSWNYISDGVYRYTKVGAFINASKVELDIDNIDITTFGLDDILNVASIRRIDNDNIEVKTGKIYVDGSNSLELNPLVPTNQAIYDNNILNNTRVLIRVWS